MTTNHAAAAPTPQELLRELQTLVAETEKMTGDAASEHSAETLCALRERFAATQERLGELYQSARQRVVAGAKYTDATIRENPYQAMAIAAGLGLLAGILLGRQSNK